MTAAAFDLVLHDVRPAAVATVAAGSRDVGPVGAAATVDVGIRDGRIAALSPERLAGAHELDGEGRLVSPGFVDPHFHADKCYAADRDRDLVDLADYIEAETDGKRRASAADVATRARRIFERLVSNGVTTVRSHVDVDTAAGLRGVEGVLAARDAVDGLLDVQLVAFPQLGIFRDGDTLDLMTEAAAMGVHAIGGHPQLERSDEDARRHIDAVFDLAVRHDLDVDVHVDETDDATSTFVADVAAATIARGWQGRVNAAHVNALAYYNPDKAARVIRRIAEAGIAVVANPTSSLLFRALRWAEPRPRGMTRVRELLAAGVPVAFGQESVKSTYIVTLRNPDPLLTAQIMAHAIQFKSPDQQQALWNMCTIAAARAVGLPDYGLVEGSGADLVVLDAATVSDAIAELAPRRWVIKRGRIVAETVVQRTVHVPTSSRATVR